MRGLLFLSFFLHFSKIIFIFAAVIVSLNM